MEIHTNIYQTATDDPIIAKKISDAEEIISFAQAQLDEQQPCDVYKELIELTLISIISVKISDAYHRVRSMTKLIYCIKI